MESRPARGDRRCARSSRLPSKLRELHRLYRLSLTGQQAPMVIDLAEVVGEVCGEVREKRARRRADAADFLGIGFGEIGFVELAHAELDRRDRVVDLPQQLDAWDVAIAEFGVAIAHVAVLTQHVA